MTSRASHPGGLEVVDAVWERCFPGGALDRDRFRYGCLNPAIVLDSSRVAVYTDLRMHPDICAPAILILEQPLKQMTGAPAQPGQRLSTISIYQQGDSTQRWLTFSPVVTNCLTDQNDEIERTLQDLDHKEWDKLKAGLRAISRRDLITAVGQWEPQANGIWAHQPGVPLKRSLSRLVRIFRVLKAIG